jgi:hypothetical protein
MQQVFCETLIAIYETTRRQIPEEFNPSVNIIKYFSQTSHRLLCLVSAPISGFQGNVTKEGYRQDFKA